MDNYRNNANEPPTYFGKFIKRWLDSIGKTQYTFNNGNDEKSISPWLSGRSPQLARLNGLAQKYGFDFDEAFKAAWLDRVKSGKILDSDFGLAIIYARCKAGMTRTDVEQKLQAGLSNNIHKFSNGIVYKPVVSYKKGSLKSWELGTSRPETTLPILALANILNTNYYKLIEAIEKDEDEGEGVA